MNRSIASTLAVAAMAALLALPANAEGGSGKQKDMGFFATRKVLSDARDAMDSKHFAEAMTLYQKILDDPDAAASHKAEALYKMAVVRLSGDDDLRDYAKARILLEKLRQIYPESDYRLEVATYFQLLMSIDRSAKAVESAQKQTALASTDMAELRTRLASCESSKQATVQSVTTQNNQVAVLEDQIKSLKSQIVTLQAEIQQKNDALKKVAETLVGGKKQP